MGFKIGHPYYRKSGYKHSQKTKKKISMSQIGIPRPYQANENHGAWKGNNVSYSGLHHWLKSRKGKPEMCVHCGTIENLDWCNTNYKYRRNLDDYISLCRKCHWKFDGKKGKTPRWLEGYIFKKGFTPWNKNKIERFCEVCNRRFELNKFREKTARFCSGECRFSWFSGLNRRAFI